MFIFSPNRPYIYGQSGNLLAYDLILSELVKKYLVHYWAKVMCLLLLLSREPDFRRVWAAAACKLVDGRRARAAAAVALFKNSSIRKHAKTFTDNHIIQHEIEDQLFVAKSSGHVSSRRHGCCYCRPSSVGGIVAGHGLPLLALARVAAATTTAAAATATS